MSEPRWLTKAREYDGTKEIVGRKHNPVVVSLWKLGKAGSFTDDETPWCAAYVSAMLEMVDVKSARTGWARGYLNWGKKLKGPAMGAIVVFSRGKKFGHVGFVCGRTRTGKLLVRGGNQDNAVNVKAFDVSRVLGYRWPEDEPLPTEIGLDKLPIGKADVSKSEA